MRSCTFAALSGQRLPSQHKLHAVSVHLVMGQPAILRDGDPLLYVCLKRLFVGPLVEAPSRAYVNEVVELWDDLNLGINKQYLLLLFDTNRLCIFQASGRIKVSEYEQEIPQSHTANGPMVP